MEIDVETQWHNGLERCALNRASGMQVSSWGRLRRVPHEVARPAFLDQMRAAASAEGGSRLCFGMGRSYGDVCTNEGGQLIVTNQLDRIMTFDRERGVLRAEAGLTLDRLLRVTVPHGWFMPVVPGTKFVTLGGAVANDVHGKNHEHVGTFGAHVNCIGFGRAPGRGLFTGGRHAEAGGLDVHRAPRFAAPFDAPGFLLNSHTIGAFNALY